MNRQAVNLESCPPMLQEAVQKKKEYAEKYYQEFRVLSVVSIESTPYDDKTLICTTHRVITSYSNTICVLRSIQLHEYPEMLSDDSLIWGDILEILRNPPDYGGLEAIRRVVLDSDAAYLLC